MAKKWIICGNCFRFYKCKAGQAKMKFVDVDSKVYNDIGCFDYQQFYYENERQLTLFNVNALKA